MKPRHAVPIIAGTLLVASLDISSAQQTAADTASAAPSQAPAVAPPSQAPAPAPVAAPAAAPAPAVRATPTLGQSLGFLEVLPPRSPDRIQSEMEVARVLGRHADADLRQSNEAKAHTRALIEVKKQEIKTVDARRKAADKAKQEADEVTFDAEKKLLERQRAFLERKAALQDTEMEEAKTRKKLAEAQQRALKLELQLANQRASRPGPGDAAGTLKYDTVIRELERNTLEAQRSQAAAATDVAQKVQDIAARRLELYRAQIAASGGR